MYPAVNPVGSLSLNKSIALMSFLHSIFKIASEFVTVYLFVLECCGSIHYNCVYGVTSAIFKNYV